MSSVSAWSTRATPLAGIAGPAVFTLGLFCLVHAAVTLALGGAAWHLPAYACMALAALLAAVRLVRARRRFAGMLRQDADGRFRLSQKPGVWTLTRVWRAPAWVTLRLQPETAGGRAIHVVVWKSAVPPPLWTELALRIQTRAPRRDSHQNKENP